MNSQDPVFIGGLQIPPEIAKVRIPYTLLAADMNPLGYTTLRNLQWRGVEIAEIEISADTNILTNFEIARWN